MPQLPSGKHIALSPAPLNRLIAAVAQGDAHGRITLVAIHTPLDCLRHFELLCWLEGELKEAAQPTGLRPADIFTARCDWAEADKQFFYKYLVGPRLTSYLAPHFLRVQKIQADMV